MNREILANDFAEATSRNRWKTFVLEAHPDSSVTQLLADAFVDSRVEATDDVYLHRLAGEVDFVVDHLDQRFWSLHTTVPTGDAAPYLRRVVNQRRDLDSMWLPSDHLRGIWSDVSPQLVATNVRAGRLTPTIGEVDDLKLRVTGRAAGRVLKALGDEFDTAVPQSHVGINVVDEHFGSITEFVSHDGRFMASGGDFGLHQAIVRRVVDRYRRFVEGAERHALRWEELSEGGARPHGAPITLRFERSIPDLGYFLEQLFSAREPFRLWGVPRYDGEGMAEVEAVDLHVGQRLRFDITTKWLRIYLFEGGCGNTVARLASNLQHHFDGALSIVDEKLDAGLRPVVNA
ncbi:MAG: hypothetical protein OXS29_14945 [bacterium]|nr:hypothetical protein [bacterium]MDE0290005.1 hypothetical protein [bacterium]